MNPVTAEPETYNGSGRIVKWAGGCTRELLDHGPKVGGVGVEESGWGPPRGPGAFAGGGLADPARFDGVDGLGWAWAGPCGDDGGVGCG